MQAILPECVGVSYLQQYFAEIVLLGFGQCPGSLCSLPLLHSLFALPVAYLIQLIHIIETIRAGDMDHYFVVRPRLEYLVTLTYEPYPFDHS
jgi:hypothetical protein